MKITLEEIEAIINAVSGEPKHSFLPGREWKNMGPFTFTATEY